MSSGLPNRWHHEFAEVIRCARCSNADGSNLLRDSDQNVPQPGYIGASYLRTRLLLVGQNPGIPGSLEVRDKEYTAALRTLRDAPSEQHYAELQLVLDAFIPSWPVHGSYFPLRESGLTLADIAYCNLVRCRTKRNAAPNRKISAACTSAHFEPWLEMLKPSVVVFIGLWPCERGRAACAARDIPHIAVNRWRSLNAEERAKNRADVAEFVRKHIHSATVD